MSLQTRIECDAEAGLLDMFDGKRHILRIERRHNDEVYSVEARPSGIQTVGANACCPAASPRTTYLTATRNELPAELTDLGFDVQTVETCVQGLDSLRAVRALPSR